MFIIPRAQATLQRTSSEKVFYDGSRRQINQSITTLHGKLIMAVQLSGSFKEVYSINGSLVAPSCGYMGNVCYFGFQLNLCRLLTIL